MRIACFTQDAVNRTVDAYHDKLFRRYKRAIVRRNTSQSDAWHNAWERAIQVYLRRIAQMQDS